MVAGLKLALPLLKATIRWHLALTMLTLAWGAWALDSVGIGLGASAGAGALIVLATALGVELRRCRSRALAHVLPGFSRTAPQAVGAVLICLVALLGLLDGWRLESLLALLAAAAFGLGLGLSLPPAWILPVPLILMLWIAVEDLDPVIIWSSTWSPVLATLWLLLASAVYSKTRQLDRSWVDDPMSESGSRAKIGGRQPHRPGHLLKLWPSLLNVAAGGILGVSLAYAAGGGDVFPRISPSRQIEVAGYLVLFAGVGIFAMLSELLSSGPQLLRRLAILPGWVREHLFLHAELSCWRVGVWLLLALSATLLATGLWAGNSMWGLWLHGLLTCWVVLLLGIYTGLWLTCVPGGAARIIILIITFLPLLLVAFTGIVHDHHLSEDRSAWVGPTVFAASLALAMWLRSQARSAWASISFGREG
ncbi:MAG: hypothetical protein ACNA7J_11335 [Wenzhouxiangella sp.]